MKPVTGPSSTADFITALTGCLNFVSGARRLIIELRRNPSDYRTSFPVEELDVLLDDGTRLGLIFKNLDRGTLTQEARDVKPAFLYDPLREIEVYERLLPSKELGTAVFYGSVTDPERHRYWLFIERVPGTEISRIGDRAIWHETARWLARMHQTLDGDRFLANPARLIHYDAELYATWMRRARQFVGVRIEWLAERYERVIERLVAMPRGIIHGEFYPSNVLVFQDQNPSPGKSAVRVCPVDWEMAAIGPPAIDLAALTSGNWSDEERRALALSYLDAIPNETTLLPQRDTFLTALEYCRLHSCVQWLGWAPKWSPPDRQAHDWLTEAHHVAERLGL